MTRIAIAGVPRAGKTWFALQIQKQTGYPVVHGDDFIPMGWSEASAEIARRLVSPGPYIVEGVVTIRGLRKALQFGPERPCDVLHWLGDPRETLRPAQSNMGAQDEKRLAEMEPELVRRGVQVLRGAASYAPGKRALAAAQAPIAAQVVVVEHVAPVAAAPSAPVAVQPFVASGESRWSGSPGRGFG